MQAAQWGEVVTIMGQPKEAYGDKKFCILIVIVAT